MLLKLIATLAFMALILPLEPDLGLGKPLAFASVDFDNVHNAALAAVTRIRADFKANAGAQQ
ncbi:MAG: hypothetical protein WDN08_14995 [Rhizomicrobium sp.]